MAKNPSANAGDAKEVGSIPGLERSLGVSTSVFLLGKRHGQRSLAGCSPWGCKESDTTEWQSSV